MVRLRVRLAEAANCRGGCREPPLFGISRLQMLAARQLPICVPVPYYYCKGRAMAADLATSPSTSRSQPDGSAARQQLIDALNDDLSREYQAIIAYVVYSQVIKGAQY